MMSSTNRPSVINGRLARAKNSFHAEEEVESVELPLELLHRTKHDSYARMETLVDLRLSELRTIGEDLRASRAQFRKLIDMLKTKSHLKLDNDRKKFESSKQAILLLIENMERLLAKTQLVTNETMDIQTQELMERSAEKARAVWIDLEKIIEDKAKRSTRNNGPGSYLRLMVSMCTIFGLLWIVLFL